VYGIKRTFVVLVYSKENLELMSVSNNDSHLGGSLSSHLCNSLMEIACTENTSLRGCLVSNCEIIMKKILCVLRKRHNYKSFKVEVLRIKIIHITCFLREMSVNVY
jgi:hypothetical protein